MKRVVFGVAAAALLAPAVARAQLAEMRQQIFGMD